MKLSNGEKKEILEDVRAGDMTPEEGRRRLGVNTRTFDAWLNNKPAPKEIEAPEGEEAAPIPDDDLADDDPRRVHQKPRAEEDPRREGQKPRPETDPRRPPHQGGPEPEVEPEREPYNDPIEEIAIFQKCLEDKWIEVKSIRLSYGELRRFGKETGKAELSEGLYTWIFEALKRVELRGIEPKVVIIGGGVEGGGNPWYYWRLQEFLANAIAHGRVLSKAEIRPGVRVVKSNALGEYVLVC